MLPSNKIERHFSESCFLRLSISLFKIKGINWQRSSQWVSTGIPAFRKLLTTFTRKTRVDTGKVSPTGHSTVSCFCKASTIVNSRFSLVIMACSPLICFAMQFYNTLFGWQFLMTGQTKEFPYRYGELFIRKLFNTISCWHFPRIIDCPTSWPFHTNLWVALSS